VVQLLPVEQICDLLGIMLDSRPVDGGFNNGVAVIVSGTCNLFEALAGFSVIPGPRPGHPQIVAGRLVARRERQRLLKGCDGVMQRADLHQG